MDSERSPIGGQRRRKHVDQCGDAMRNESIAGQYGVNAEWFLAKFVEQSHHAAFA